MRFDQMQSSSDYTLFWYRESMGYESMGEEI